MSEITKAIQDKLREHPEVFYQIVSYHFTTKERERMHLEKGKEAATVTDIFNVKSKKVDKEVKVSHRA